MSIEKSKILEKGREQFAARMKSAIARPAELAEKIGVSTASVYNYRNGKIPEADVLLRIAEETGTDWRWLLTGKEIEAGRDNGGATLVKVPILADTIAAGPGREVDFSRHAEGFLEVPIGQLRKRHVYYCLRLTGDSMEPYLYAGDLMLVNLTRRDPRVLKQRIVVAYLPSEDGATVKILFEDETEKFWVLRASNPLYRDLVVPKKEEKFQVASVEAIYPKGGEHV